MEKIINAFKEMGFDVISCRIPSNKPTDGDIDKVYIKSLSGVDVSPEAVAYRRVRSIANHDAEKVKWNIAIQFLTEDVNTIANAIKTDTLKYPEELKEFVENCCAIMDFWDNKYRQDFNLIKTYRDSVKTPKSIDDMDADELRKYIRIHNI